MVADLFNKDRDRAISPIVGAPRPDQIVQGFSPLKWPPASDMCAISSIEGAPGSHQVFRGTPPRLSELHMRNVTVDYKLAESMSLEIDPQGKKAMREIWDEYVKDLEARLLAAICEKLRANGRIAPGEPLLKEPDPNGRGFTLYRFPG
jgi:hypothetical protein